MDLPQPNSEWSPQMRKSFESYTEQAKALIKSYAKWVDKKISGNIQEDKAFVSNQASLFKHIMDMFIIFMRDNGSPKLTGWVKRLGYYA